MLVLSRRVGEEIIINNNIRVTIVAAKGDRIRIGVQAPRDVSVDRAEVHERRMQFVELPVGAADDHVESDADVPIGVLPAIRTEDDTMVH